eukprot:CAMPEP_0195530606 /NCGR_PEP_ID=MMETSP0794_2-20130614/33580_1 /TAXON_ID=515487 /ORGANISM="Stephanopyxis turris, Strain CCMP 815" /LENGTH=213 /DNA_ID=CAMNT_0040662155 /DNA_START=18 /DNA_END=656 /DNA_ORIENTATION=+
MTKHSFPTRGSTSFGKISKLDVNRSVHHAPVLVKVTLVAPNRTNHIVGEGTTEKTRIITAFQQKDTIAQATRRLMEHSCPDLFVETIFRSHCHDTTNCRVVRLDEKKIRHSCINTPFITFVYGDGAMSTFVAVATNDGVGKSDSNNHHTEQQRQQWVVNVNTSLSGYLIPFERVGDILKDDDNLLIDCCNIRRWTGGSSPEIENIPAAQVSSD